MSAGNGSEGSSLCPLPASQNYDFGKLPQTLGIDELNQAIPIALTRLSGGHEGIIRTQANILAAKCIISSFIVGLTMKMAQEVKAGNLLRDSAAEYFDPFNGGFWNNAGMSEAAENLTSDMTEELEKIMPFETAIKEEGYKFSLLGDNQEYLQSNISHNDAIYADKMSSYATILSSLGKVASKTRIKSKEDEDADERINGIKPTNLTVMANELTQLLDIRNDLLRLSAVNFIAAVLMFLDDIESPVSLKEFANFSEYEKLNNRVFPMNGGVPALVAIAEPYQAYIDIDKQNDWTDYRDTPMDGLMAERRIDDDRLYMMSSMFSN